MSETKIRTLKAYFKGVETLVNIYNKVTYPGTIKKVIEGSFIVSEWAIEHLSDEDLVTEIGDPNLSMTAPPYKKKLSLNELYVDFMYNPQRYR